MAAPLQLDFFPRNATVTPVTVDLIASAMHLELSPGIPNPALKTYYLLIPNKAWIEGAKTFDQFARHYGTSRLDASLFQLFLAQYVRKGGAPFRGSRKGCTLTLLNVHSKAWLLTLREIVNDEAAENATDASGGGDDGDDSEEGKKKKARHRVISFSRWVTSRLTCSSALVELEEFRKPREAPLQEWQDLCHLRSSDYFVQTIAAYRALPLKHLLEDAGEWKKLGNEDEGYALWLPTVFSLEHALKRYADAFGETLEESDLMDTEHPDQAFAVPYTIAYPGRLKNYFMPSFQPVADYNSIAYRSFADRYAFSGMNEDELRALFHSNVGFSQAHSTTLNIDAFTLMNRQRLEALEPYSLEWESMQREVFREFNSVFNELVDSGDAFQCTIAFMHDFLARNHGHFALPPGTNTVAIELDPFVAIAQDFIGMCEDTGSVAYVHPIIFLLVAAIHSNAQDDDKGLNLSVILAGMAGVSKSFAQKLAAKFGIPALCKFLAWRSMLAKTMNRDDRGHVHMFDELPSGQVDIPTQLNDSGLFLHVRNRGSASTGGDRSAVNKNTTTNRTASASHLVIDKGGERKTLTSTSVMYGVTLCNMNDPHYLIPKTQEQRNMIVDVKQIERTNGDMVTAMRQQELTEHVERLYQQKISRAMGTWFHRSQCVSTMYYILKNTGAIPDINLSGFDLRIDLLMTTLSTYTGIEPRVSRYFLNLQRFAKVFTLWRAIYLYMDLGIGGYDRGKPFEVSDLQGLAPLLVCTDPITFFTAELLPIFQPVLMMDVLNALQQLMDEYTPPSAADTSAATAAAALPPPAHSDNGAYVTLYGFFPSKVAQQPAYVKCKILALQIHAKLSKQHDLLAIQSALAELCNNIVLAPNGSRIPAIDLTDTLVYDPNLRIHRSVKDHPVTENSVLEAWTKILHPLTPARTMLRGKMDTTHWRGFLLAPNVKPDPMNVVTKTYQTTGTKAPAAPAAPPAEAVEPMELEEGAPEASILPPVSERQTSFFFGTFEPPSASVKAADKPQIFPPGASPAARLESINTEDGRQQCTPYLDEEIIERHLKGLRCCHPMHYAFPHNLKNILMAVDRVRTLIHRYAGEPLLEELSQAATQMWQTYRKHKALPNPLSAAHVREMLTGMGLKYTTADLDWATWTDELNAVLFPPSSSSTYSAHENAQQRSAKRAKVY